MSLGVTDQEVRVVDDPTVIKVAEKLGKNPSTNTNCGAGNLQTHTTAVLVWVLCWWMVWVCPV